MTSFRNFGYIRQRTRSDIYRWLVGYPNLMKRLQARDIMGALQLRPTDRVLDFGCAYGVFTIEMAKIAAEAVGIDIAPPEAGKYLKDGQSSRLRFLDCDARATPFEDDCFDVVLASEVLMMVGNPEEFLDEIRRVLKPGGRLVVVNGTGHLAIKKAYETDSRLLRLARRLWPGRVPVDYEAYVQELYTFFGTAFPFRSKEYYRELLRNNGFDIEKEISSPSYGANAAASWDQFLFFLRTGRPNPVRFFGTKYVLFSLLGRAFPKGESSGQILISTAR
jgi:ubiquinone/menaquinone biosynthesis C-methylase UbiE